MNSVNLPERIVSEMRGKDRKLAEFGEPTSLGILAFSWATHYHDTGLDSLKVADSIRMVNLLLRASP